MAVARVFTCATRLAGILRSSNVAVENLAFIQKRCGNFRTSPKYEDPSKYTDYEISKDASEWKWVENYIPRMTVPAPPTEATVSGWKPQKPETLKLPYFIRRTKNHMQPVYLLHNYRGMRKITHVKKIEGDIWQLETELREHLERECNVQLHSQINELAGHIKFKGDFVSKVIRWMDQKGF